jgi:hypothetical protein
MVKKYVGIDPSMRLNGFAVCIIDEDKLYFGRYKKLADWAKDALTWATDIVVVVEDSSLQNITFYKYHDGKSRTKISRNVGMNQGASRFTIDWLELYGHTVKGISPQEKGKKWTLDYAMSVIKGMKLTVNGNKKLSQDEIDAFQLALIAKAIFL